MSFGVRLGIVLGVVLVLPVGGLVLFAGPEDVSPATAGAGWVWLSAAAALVLAGLGGWLYRSVSGPAAEIAAAADRVAAGDFDARVDPGGPLGALAERFNRMASKLSETTLDRSTLDDALDSMAGALLLVDTGYAVERVNGAALTLLGYERDELVGRPFDTVCPAPAGGASPILRLAVEGHLRGVEQTFVRGDGSTLPVSFSGSTLRDPGGEIVGFVCVAHDLSRHKQVERAMRESIARKETLLREVHHRVKNNLQVILSLLDLQSGYFEDEAVLAMFAESRNRIRAMALIHEQLYSAPNADEIAVGDYLESLVGQLFHSHGVGPERIELAFRLHDQPLDSDQAVAVGLIVNELVTNALEHAFPDGRRGEVRVELGARRDGMLELLVADDGRGLDEDFDLSTLRSLGLNLVASLAKQLRGELDVRGDGGARFAIRFPARRPMEENVPRAGGT